MYAAADCLFRGGVVSFICFSSKAGAVFASSGSEVMLCEMFVMSAPVPDACDRRQRIASLFTRSVQGGVVRRAVRSALQYDVEKNISPNHREDVSDMFVSDIASRFRRFVPGVTVGRTGASILCLT